MDIVLFSHGARLALFVAAVALGLATLVLRWRRAGERWLVLSSAGLALSLLVLAGEQLIGLLVSSAQPQGVDFNEWRWVIAAPWGRAGIGIAFTLVALTLVLSWRGTRREPRLARRALLVSMRAGACAAALILFLEPALELRHVMREPNHVVVLVDDSRSMELAEKLGGPTRAERAARVIARSAGTFDRWRDNHLIDFFTFSDTVQPAGRHSLVEAAPAHGDSTLLREALENIRGRYDSRDLAGIVVVSDGIATGRFGDGVQDGVSQDFLTGLGTRVHAVWAGRPGLRDLAIARVNAADFAFVRTAVKIEAVVRQTGVEAQDVPVTLTRDGQVVRTVTVQVGGGVSEARATFEFVPERIGKYVYEVSVPVLAGEAIPSNNARAFVLRVGREKTRVLQVAGRPSEDVAWLRRFFKANKNVDLISFFILRTESDIERAPPQELSLIPFPTEELFDQQLGSFDVIVLQNFEHAPYRITPYLENIRAYVEAGGGLAMVGGDLSFSSGGYFQTPVAEALPVELMPGADAEHLLSIDEFRPQITAEGLGHPITQLRFDRRDNEARWAGLPPLEGMNLVVGAKPNATVLAEHPTLRARGGRPMPVIVAGEYGKGRSLAVLTDSTWRWGFWPGNRAGDDGRAYHDFWTNAVNWLIRDPVFEYLHVESDQAEYAQGTAPRILVHLVDKDYRPTRGEVTLRIEPRGGTGSGKAAAFEKTVKTDESTGEAELPLPLVPAGVYKVTGSAPLGDKRVTAEDVFLVNPARQEMERPGAREDVLAGIARATGGSYLGAAEEIDPGLAFAPPRVVRVDRRSDVELWSRPYLFLLALAFLGAEWALRRRRGFL